MPNANYDNALSKINEANEKIAVSYLALRLSLFDVVTKMKEYATDYTQLATDLNDAATKLNEANTALLLAAPDGEDPSAQDISDLNSSIVGLGSFVNVTKTIAKDNKEYLSPFQKRMEGSVSNVDALAREILYYLGRGGVGGLLGSIASIANLKITDIPPATTVP